MKKKPVLFLGELRRSPAGPNNDAKSPPLFQRQGSGIQPCRLQSLARSAQRKRQHSRHVLAVFFFNPGQLVEPANLACDLDLDLRRIKPRDAANSAAPLEDGVGEFGRPYTVRRYNSHPGNDAAFFHKAKVERSGAFPPPQLQTYQEWNSPGLLERINDVKIWSAAWPNASNTICGNFLSSPLANHFRLNTLILLAKYSCESWHNCPGQNAKLKLEG